MAALALCACKPHPDQPSSEEAGKTVPTVLTAPVEAVSVPRIVDLPGRLAALRTAEVRAQISGIIQKRCFEEGSTVRAGDVLFRIDSSLYQAEVDAQAAALARAEAARAQAQRQEERTATLLQRDSVSTAQHDVALAALRQAEADVGSAKAYLNRARINLAFTEIRAPIEGRIGRALVTEGALVDRAEATKLAVIQQIDPIFADFKFSTDDDDLLAGRQASEVRLVDSDGSVYPDPGRLLFADASVDPGTEQVGMRATFPNPKSVLLPGAYVRVRVSLGPLPGAVIVPAQAIQRSSAGEAQAYVVGQDGKVALRPLRTGGLTDRGWIVEKGLKPGETVVVEGFQKIQPGAEVKATAMGEGSPAPRQSVPVAAQERRP